jgi:hypothetical protein
MHKLMVYSDRQEDNPLKLQTQKFDPSSFHNKNFKPRNFKKKKKFDQ